MNPLILKKMFLLIILMSFTACNFSCNEKSTTLEAGIYETNETFTDASEVEIKSNIQETKPFNISDSKNGLDVYTIWYPSNWEQVKNSKEWTFKGPNGVKISSEFGRFFTFGNSYGGQNPYDRPPMNINAIIDEFFMKTARQNQRKLLKIYEVPEVAQTELQYMVQLWQYAPTEKKVNTYAVEWEDPNQMKFITLINVTIHLSQLGSGWGINGRYLEAEAAHFETAKAAFLKGMETKVYNQQWIANYNNDEMQKANISNQAHQRRMAAINSRVNETSNIGKIYSDISDINHSGYLSRSNMTDHGHSKTISGIRETVTVSNHNTGEHYSVPMGSKNYWVSNQGTYFGTDNSLYNPNTDMNMNNKDWTKFEVEN